MRVQFTGNVQGYSKRMEYIYFYYMYNYRIFFEKLHYRSKAKVEWIRWLLCLDHYGCIMVYQRKYELKCRFNIRSML